MSARPGQMLPAATDTSGHQRLPEALRARTCHKFASDVPRSIAARRPRFRMACATNDPYPQFITRKPRRNHRSKRH